MSVSASAYPHDDTIVVDIPADTAHFRMLRLTAAVVAADLLDVAAVDDLQIGVEEAAAILLGSEPGGRMQAAMWSTGERLHVQLRRSTGAHDPDPDPDDFRRTILDAVVDDLTIENEPDTGMSTVAFTKSP